MAEKLMIVCDNPDCQSVGVPEWVPGQDGARKKKGQTASAPYGWHDITGYRMGPGPNYTAMACGEECIGPAVIHQLRMIRLEEEGAFS